MPHMAVDFDVFDLQIGNRRFEMRVPVDQTFATVDQPLVIHLDKDLEHGIVEVAGLFACGRAFGT